MACDGGGRALHRARAARPLEPVVAPANVPRFTNLRAACAAAVQAEVENIALYDSQLGASLPEDVLRVLLSNRAASVNNHLPAFQRCQ